MLYLQSLYDFEVGLDDVNSIAPLILHSKTSMYGEWVENNFNGNSYFACQSFLKVVYERLDFFMKNILKGCSIGKTMGKNSLRRIKECARWPSKMIFTMKG